MLQRIHIIRGPGSGKSYAARHLSHLLFVPAYDLDDLFWDSAAQSYGMRASDADRDAKLMASQMRLRGSLRVSITAG